MKIKKSTKGNLAAIAMLVASMGGAAWYYHVTSISDKQPVSVHLRTWAKEGLLPVLLVVAVLFLFYLLFRYRSFIAEGVRKGVADIHAGTWKLGGFHQRHDLNLLKLSRTPRMVEQELAEVRISRDRASGTAREVFQLRVNSLKNELAGMAAARLRATRRNRDGQKPGSLEYLRLNVEVKRLKIELAKYQSQGDGKRNAELIQSEMDLARAERAQHNAGTQPYKDFDGRVQRRKAELATLQKPKQ